MSNQESETSNEIIQNQHVTLLDLLDRLVDKGVVVKGEVLLTVADIDLVYLNLALLLSSVKTVEKAAGKDTTGKEERLSRRSAAREAVAEEIQREAATETVPTPPASRERAPGQTSRSEDTIASMFPPTATTERERQLQPKANIDPKNVEQGLVKLVLTLVDLIRQLMEKQAIRRIEEGQLTEQEIENVGNAFFLLDEKIEELKRMFDLTDEDLNLDLGPLGELL